MVGRLGNYRAKTAIKSGAQLASPPRRPTCLPTRLTGTPISFAWASTTSSATRWLPNTECPQEPQFEGPASSGAFCWSPHDSGKPAGESGICPVLVLPADRRQRMAGLQAASSNPPGGLQHRNPTRGHVHALRPTSQHGKRYAETRYQGRGAKRHHDKRQLGSPFDILVHTPTTRIGSLRSQSRK
jgi:hypothetical protein